MLSQYLTAIQCSGEFPPAETGLTYNSWYGKFHLEMHWWHAVHFALWDRLPTAGTEPRLLLRDSASRTGSGQATRLPRRPLAENDGPQRGGLAVHGGAVSRLAAAASDLLRGVVLPGPSGLATLEKYRDVVFETANFMASYATWDEATKRFVLGPPLQGAQEEFPKDRTMNLTFELTYWRWGLERRQVAARAAWAAARQGLGQRAGASFGAAGGRRKIRVRRNGAGQLHESPLAERPPGRARGVWHAAGAGNR